MHPPLIRIFKHRAYSVSERLSMLTSGASKQTDRDEAIIVCVTFGIQGPHIRSKFVLGVQINAF